jgi:peptide chain release factor 2/peptide chain release factor
MSAARDGFLVQVTAGSGPVEVRRFVALLAERIRALCEERGVEVIEVTTRGDEAEPWSVEIEVRGDAPALLGDEVGTHTLVSQSPERGRAARKRWFAGVALHPLAPAAEVAPLSARDLEITSTTARGPGGQHVNKAATAVRVRHLPTGLTVRVDEERSRRANLQRALEMLAARLTRAGERREAEGTSARRMAHYRVERGAPVRAYQLDARGRLVGGAA